MDRKSSYPHIEEGMVVYSHEGDKLGKVVQVDEYSITIEKGFFFPKEFTLRYDDVEAVSGDRVIINTQKDELSPWQSERYPGWDEIERANLSDEVRVPLREEELDVEKTMRTTGNVRIRKVVHTELRNISVPVSKEEVIVERVPASETGDIPGSESAYREEEYNIPVREEEIDVRKRSVVKEEVRFSKQSHTEQENISDKVRREDVEIERDREHKPKKPF